MASFTNRFHAVQKSASELFAELELKRIIAESDTRSSDSDVRAAAFVALQHIRYAVERTLAVFDTLRKGKASPLSAESLKQAPVVTGDDYERFLERCFGIAEGLSVSSNVVAAGIVSQAELALGHARNALKNARRCYSDTGVTLDR